MEIPRRLYKYRAGTSRDVTGLSAAKLWFSPPASFNDPFDCGLDIAIPNITRAECVALLGSLTDGNVGERDVATISDSDLQSSVRSALQAVTASGLDSIRGVCCFSEIATDLLMWGHYCNGHRGF